MRGANESLSWFRTAWRAAGGGAVPGFDPGVLALSEPRRTAIGPRVVAEAAVPGAGGARPANRVQLPARGEVPLPAPEIRTSRGTRVATVITPGFPIAVRPGPRPGEATAAGRAPGVRAALDVTDSKGAPVERVTWRHACFQAAGSDAVAPLRASRSAPQPIVPDGTHRDARDPAPWPSRPTWAWSDHRPQADLDGVSERSAERRAPGRRATGGLFDAPAWPPAGAAAQAFASAAPAAAPAIALAIDPGTTPRRAVAGTPLPGCRSQSPPLAGALSWGGAGATPSLAAP
ncbi:MAG: hypothetical protein O9972_13160 [Burkholderiales bacterium]|jgi:hypothetical protein|nr:hypothetical protein [Burkholderiales bacterium]